MKTKFAWILAALTLAAAAQLRAEEERKDVILFEDGTDKKVDKVEEENYASVSYSSGGRTVKVKAADVKEILYADAPQSYRNAMGMMNQRRFKDAIEEFQNAAKASGVRDWIKVYTNFYIGECYRALGVSDPANYETAAEHYEALLKEAPLSRLLPDAMYYLGVSLTRAKKYKEANDIFQKLVTEVGTKSLDESWGRMADLEQARVKEAQKLYDEAYAKYNSIFNLYKDSDPTIANMARLRMGICLLAQNKFDQAKKYFEDLGREAKGEGTMIRETRAGAAIGLGHCFYNDKNFVEARHHFLKAVVVFFSDEFRPQALFYAGMCNEALKGSEPQADLNAKRLFSDLIALYPSSEWAKKAMEKGYKDLKEE